MKKLLTISFSTFLFSLFTFLCSAQYTNLLNFNDTNGAYPRGSLALFGNKLYGMTPQGGANKYGSIFSIDTNGNNYTILHSFKGIDGAGPYGDLTLSGNKFYGMTFVGGGYGYGCIFSMNTDGSRYQVLWAFNPPVNGQDPEGNLTVSGNKLFGTIQAGGPGYVGGYIFSIDTNGSNFQILHPFSRISAGGAGNLILLGNTLFGTAGGGANNYGCIYSMHTDSTNFKDIFDFNHTNGGLPGVNLTLIGNVLYGIAYGGGANNFGCIFSLDTNGNNYRNLYNFNNAWEGYNNSKLILSENKFFGMMDEGGLNNDGYIFSIDTNGYNYKDWFDFNGINGKYPNGYPTISGSILYGMTDSGGVSGKYGVIFKLDTTNIGSGVNQLSVVSGQWSVYPNPSNGVFTIQSSVVRGHPDSYRELVEVYNVLGEQVKSEKLKVKNSVIDLSGQPSGVYFYRILKGDGGLVGEGKVVVEK